jgi:hypothetical protein
MIGQFGQSRAETGFGGAGKGLMEKVKAMVGNEIGKPLDSKKRRGR